MNIPITQSEEWRKLQQDLEEKTLFDCTKSYQYLAILKHTPVGNYLYLPYGPVAEDVNAMKQAIKAVTAIARREHVMFIRIEPQLPNWKKYLPENVKKSTDLNPKETWLLDLSGTDEELKSKLPSRLLRYYKNREKQGITIVTSHNPQDIHYLLDLQRALAHEKGISTFSEHYLATELKQPFSTLYMLKRNDNILAAGLVFDHDKTRYNLQGAQSDEGRRLHATGILTIQLILDAKAKGNQTFDFWGIAPEDAPDNHPWKGFTAFKKTFTGYERDYAGTYDIVLTPSRYRFYQIIRKLRRSLK